MKAKLLSAIWTAAILMAYIPMCFAWEPGGEIRPVPPDDGVTAPVVQVLGVVQWIGFIVAIAMIIYVGIKYLTSGAGEKAKVKDTLIPMLIGAVLVALGPTIAKAVFTTLNPTSTTP